MAFCPNCGSKIADGNEYCLFCGTKITEGGSAGSGANIDDVGATVPVRPDDYGKTVPAYNQNVNQGYNQPQHMQQPQYQQPQPQQQQYQQPARPQYQQQGYSQPKNNKPLIIGIISALSVAIIACIVVIVMKFGGGDDKDSSTTTVASGINNKTTETTTERPTTEATTEATTTEATTEATTTAALNPASEARQIIENIQANPEYYPSDADMVICCDVNYDGVQELIAMYKENHDGEIRVYYEAWWLGPNETKLQSLEWLYTEVGGNIGAVGVIEHSGVRKLGIYASTADGMTYTNFMWVDEWINGGQDLDTDNERTFAEKINIEENRTDGYFQIDDTQVSMDEYDSAMSSIEWVYKMQPYSTEPDNINIMSFDYFLSHLD